MKRLTMAVAMFVIVALVSPSFVLARDEGAGTPTPEQKRARMGAAQNRQNRPVAGHPRLGGVQQLFRVALLAARAREDAELQTMVDKAIQDRKHLLKLETKHMGIFEELVAAIRVEDKELAKAKSDELKAVRETIKTRTRQLVEDIRAIAQRLHAIMPGLGEKTARGSGGEAGQGRVNRPEARGKGRQGGRGAKPADAEDLPVDIY